jgi:hypothetical protein
MQEIERRGDAEKHASAEGHAFQLSTCSAAQRLSTPDSLMQSQNKSARLHAKAL